MFSVKSFFFYLKYYQIYQIPQNNDNKYLINKVIF